MSEPPARRTRFKLARHRLQRSDFKRVYERGRRAQGALFAVVVLENGLEHSRVGLSVAKRHFKLAVTRNKVRRVLREAFRLELASLPRGLDVVLVANAAARRPVLVQVRAELVSGVGRALAKRPRAAPPGAAR